VIVDIFKVISRENCHLIDIKLLNPRNKGRPVSTCLQNSEIILLIRPYQLVIPGGNETLHYAFRIGTSTISEFVPVVCQATIIYRYINKGFE